VIESSVTKLEGWQGEGSSRTVLTTVDRVFFVSGGMEIGRERVLLLIALAGQVMAMKAVARDCFVRFQVFGRRQADLEEKPGIACECDGRSFGRVRAEVMVATDNIASWEVRNTTDGLGWIRRRGNIGGGRIRTLAARRPRS